MFRWLKNRRKKREIVRLRLAIGRAGDLAQGLSRDIAAACKSGDEFCEYAEALRFAAGVLASIENTMNRRLDVLSGKAPQQKEAPKWISQTKRQRPMTAI